MTVDWYKTFYEGGGESMREFAHIQIKEYSKLAFSQQISWTKL